MNAYDALTMAAAECRTLGKKYSGITHLYFEDCELAILTLRESLLQEPAELQGARIAQLEDECHSLSALVQSLDTKCAELEQGALALHHKVVQTYGQDIPHGVYVESLPQEPAEPQAAENRPNELISVTLEGVTHTRTAREWLELSRAAIDQHLDL